MAWAPDALARLEDELEDYLLSLDPCLIARLGGAPAEHLVGRVRALADLKHISSSVSRDRIP